MDGQISRQSSSYRQGLVLGLTMAEIMILLVFCLLIAMAAFLKIEQTKRAEAEEQVHTEQINSKADRDLVVALKQSPSLYEKLSSAAAAGDAQAVDEFWRELVESLSMVSQLKKGGLSDKDIRERLADAELLKSRGISTDKALRDADIVGSIEKIMPAAGQTSTPAKLIADAVGRGLVADTTSGHQWPPIISLSEANGYFFKSGSAELSPEFRSELAKLTPERIAALIKQFDVDVIEVVGHTDEQPIGVRPSNLDRDLVSVLRSHTNVASLVPADNAGLGLARAVSVVSVLLQSPLLSGYKLIPLSGAQLVNTDETLAVTGAPGDIRERRRIEIRLRKSTPHDTSVSASSTPVLLPRPRPRPKPPPAITRPNVQPLNLAPGR
jgi:flagellar motor protein MotB